MKIRTGDTVMVLRGKDAGKRGRVHQVLTSESRVIVEGVNIIKRHTKPRGTVRQAGIIEREAPIHASKVMLVCSKCNRPTRIGHRFLDDGAKVRVCVRCQEVIE